MATLSVRLQDDIIKEIKVRADALSIPKTEYVRRAILAMNDRVAREMRRKRIFEASKRVRKESMRINAEFSAAEDAPNV